MAPYLTSLRIGVLSLDPELMWEIRKSGNSQKNLKVIIQIENTALKLSEYTGTKITRLCVSTW